MTDFMAPTAVAHLYQLQFLIQRCSRLEKLSIVGCQNVFDFERAFRHP